MLTRLFIQNLLLIRSQVLEFDPGFTVLTGESGAGKSVILGALLLVLGQKKENDQIRAGEKKAIIEASFELESANDHTDSILTLLHDAGIDSDAEELIIRRELTDNGRSRCFINNQLVTLSFLKKVSSHLIHFCGQHAHLELFSKEAQLAIIDRFAKCHDEKKAFASLFKEHQAIEHEIDALKKALSERDRLIEETTKTIEELEALDLTDGSDERLFSLYAEQTKNQEMQQELFQLTEELDSESGILQALYRLKPRFAKIEKLERFLEVTNLLQELTYELTRDLKDIEVDDLLFEKTTSELEAIEEAKKRYRMTVDELAIFLEKQKKHLCDLIDSDVALDALLEKKKSIDSALSDAASALTTKRKNGGKLFEKAITKELLSLNMPNASFEVLFDEEKRSLSGDESCCFYLKANSGFSKKKVSESASGGELSRILLAIKCAEKTDQRILFIFDEIDANIGGKTALVVGEKLKNLSCNSQILAITHFPQVAKFADHHFLLEKKDSGTITETVVEKLVSTNEKSNELQRMVGHDLDLCLAK